MHLSLSALVEGAAGGLLSLRKNAELEGFPPDLVSILHQEVRENLDGDSDPQAAFQVVKLRCRPRIPAVEVAGLGHVSSLFACGPSAWPMLAEVLTGWLAFFGPFPPLSRCSCV